MPRGQNRVRSGKPVQAMVQKTFGQGARRHARRKSSPASTLDWPYEEHLEGRGGRTQKIRVKTPENRQSTKKVTKGKKSIVDRVLGKVGIKRKKQR